MSRDKNIKVWGNMILGMRYQSHNEKAFLCTYGHPRWRLCDQYPCSPWVTGRNESIRLLWWLPETAQLQCPFYSLLSSPTLPGVHKPFSQTKGKKSVDQDFRNHTTLRPIWGQNYQTCPEELASTWVDMKHNMFPEHGCLLLFINDSNPNLYTMPWEQRERHSSWVYSRRFLKVAMKIFIYCIYF